MTSPRPLVSRLRRFHRRAMPSFFLLLAFGAWFFFQHPQSPLVRTLDRILRLGDESGLETMISVIGVDTYQNFLQFVAIPLCLLMVILLVLCWYLARRERARSVLIERFLVYPDRLMILARDQRLSFPLDPGLQISKTSQPRKEASMLQKLREGVSFGAPQRRYFSWQNGALGMTPPVWTGWKLNANREVRAGNGAAVPAALLNSAFEQCPSLRRGPARGDFVQLAASLPFIAVFFFLLAAASLSGLYPWLPMLRVEQSCGSGESRVEALAVAEARPSLRVGCLFEAFGKGGEARSPESFGQFQQILMAYFEAGGDEFGMRLNQALLHLGDREPRTAFAWLSPMGTTLDLRLAHQAGDLGILAQQYARYEQQPDRKEEGPWGHWLQGRPQLARQGLEANSPTQAEAAIFNAVLWTLLGDSERRDQLMELEMVEVWLEEQSGDQETEFAEVLERSFASPAQAFFQVRRRNIRALAAYLNGDCRRGQNLREQAESLSRSVGMPGWLDLDRYIWESLGQCVVQQSPEPEEGPHLEPGERVRTRKTGSS